MRLRSSTPLRRARVHALLIAAPAGGLAAQVRGRGISDASGLAHHVDADLQVIANPGMNADRGPAVAAGVRPHADH